MNTRRPVRRVVRSRPLPRGRRIGLPRGRRIGLPGGDSAVVAATLRVETLDCGHRIVTASHERARRCEQCPEVRA